MMMPNFDSAIGLALALQSGGLPAGAIFTVVAGDLTAVLLTTAAALGVGAVMAFARRRRRSAVPETSANEVRKAA